MSTGSFEVRTALVTGGSRGIGLGIASALLDRGARVALTARRPESLAEAARELDAGDRVLCLPANAGDTAAAADVVGAVLSRFGTLDMLVNNAGINPVSGPLMDTEIRAVEKTLQVNTVGALALTQQAWHGWMREHGGSIVNIASVAGLRSSSPLGAYAVSKAAMIHLTVQLAAELAPGVRVNAVAPAVIKTRFARALYEGHEEEVAARYPLRRLGVPQDVAAAVCFLLSDEASWITGETLAIDGGSLKVAVERPSTAGRTEQAAALPGS
jgi:NAD(P)-dependent dehydrogenase (short-subunit alcohol dehydrogenase family)